MQSIHEGRKALATGVDGNVRNFPVERIANFEQFVQPRARIGSLQKRAILVVSRAVEKILHARPQIYDRASGAKPFSVLPGQHCASSGGEDDFVQCGQFVDDHRFAMAKSRLTFDLEDHGYFYPGSLLYHVVGVIKNFVQALRQHAANRSLARTHHPDQENVTWY